jgi:hypothetical protein
MAREHIQISEVQTEQLRGGVLVLSMLNQTPDDPVLPDYIIDPYGLRRAAQFAKVNHRGDEHRVSSFRSIPEEATARVSAQGKYDHLDLVKSLDCRTFSHVDFQFPRDATLIVTFRGEARLPQISNPKQLGRGGRFGENGKFAIIGLEPGQRFSLRAESGELRLSSRADAELKPDAEVEILMERHKTAKVAGRMLNKPTPPANVGLTMYLYMASGVD